MRQGPEAAPAGHAARHAPLAPERRVERLDRVVARALRVAPQPAGSRDVIIRTSSPPFETPLLVSAVRCLLRYVLLPLVFPLLGLGVNARLDLVTGAALGGLLLLDVAAVIAIVATLRRLWHTLHPRRWQYLPVALALVALVGVFIVNDTRAAMV